jgi:hypothetical protein
MEYVAAFSRTMVRLQGRRFIYEISFHRERNLRRKDYSVDTNVITSLRGIAQNGIWFHRWEEEQEEDKKDSSPTTTQWQVTTLIPYRKLHLVVLPCKISLHSSCISNSTNTRKRARTYLLRNNRVTHLHGEAINGIVLLAMLHYTALIHQLFC